MSTQMLITIAVVGLLLITAFVLVTVVVMRRTTRRDSTGTDTAAVRVANVPFRPVRILLATDGSPCSDRAIESVLSRLWPSGSRVAVVTVIHTPVPLIPEPFLTGAAAHVQALEEDRAKAPGRVEAAKRRLAVAFGDDVETHLLEGGPAEVLIAEARRWDADLIVVGSHGYGRAKRMLLGSVSEAVARGAHCSVEIVRCPHAA
jgi:nucleotide-binding universal stress UspA family protein